MEQLTPVDPPAAVMHVLSTLWDAGHAAFLVGGGVRDALLGKPVTDWDVASDALPERLLELFPAGGYDNRFGTVRVPSGDLELEVTTFRRDHQYADHRRPDSVTFTTSLDEDLARRDFTVNAIAWSRDGLNDPTGGLPDLAAGLLRAVGDPATRFDEDALRLLRAARLAAQLDFQIEPQTLAAMRQTAESVRYVSAERIGAEVEKMLLAEPPSRAFRILEETGVLAHALPELAAQRGVAQDKAPGMDLWDHTLATLDAAAQIDPPNVGLRMAALLHDIGKPSTFADGHFIGHDTVGADMAEKLLVRLALSRAQAEWVANLIRNHMFSYEPQWSAAAVRRFIRRVGPHWVRVLLELRAADNIGSGLPANAGHLDQLGQRVSAEFRANAPLTRRELAVHGQDLVSELGIAPAPVVGRLLDHLLEFVLDDPSHNVRAALISEARAELERTNAG